MIPIGSATLQADLDGVAFTTFTYRPARRPAALLLLFHGRSRNAQDFRDFAIDLAEAQDAVVIAPLFDEARFPPSSYHRGNITDTLGRPRRRAEWTTRFVPQLLRWAEECSTLPYWLWGFSAGGQFLSRVAAFGDAGTPRRIVIASPSSHVLPLSGRHPRGEAAPYGMGGVFDPAEARAAQRRYLALPITLYVGARDCAPGDTSLARDPAAGRQGTNRVERARRAYDLGAAMARSEGWDFAWRLMVEPDIGHSASQPLIAHRARRILGLNV